MKYRVLIPEIHYVESMVEASSPEEARRLVGSGRGEYMQEIDYSRPLGHGETVTEEWEVTLEDEEEEE